MIPLVANRQPPLHRLQKGPGFRAGAKNRKHLQMRMKMAFRNRSWAQAFVWGHGPPLASRMLGKHKNFTDGLGLCSPGRWAPQRRLCARECASLGFAEQLGKEYTKLLNQNLDVRQVALQLALGRLEKSPFCDELVQEGRELLFCALELVGTKLPVRSRPEGQPFFLAALEELLRISGDPDFRAFYSSSVSFAHGVRVGFKSKTPRVRDGCTCRGIRRSLIASHFLTPPCLDFEQVLICFRCPSVQERISNRKKKGQWKGAAKFVASVVVFFSCCFLLLCCAAPLT